MSHKLQTMAIVLFVSAAIFFFFTYRILEVPSGLTSDENAFGYNAALLSKTAHDENGRFMPVFVLSIHGTDWRQPVTQYYLTGLFKIFGSSVYLLRTSSVLITILSFWLIYFLTAKLFDRKMAALAGIIFLTTPLIMIQSHFGLDNIMPIPFTIFFLIGIYYFSQHFQIRYLFLAAVALGIGFYTYKGMRAIVPAWIVISSVYLLLITVKKDPVKKTFRYLFLYGLFLLPFFAIIPILELKYAHAVFGTNTGSFDSVYQFLYPYFSSYDLTFLYIRGDDLLYHSTHLHGMMLLTTFPLFIIGTYQAMQRKNFWSFVLLVFFLGPLMYGLVGSVHRASRLMALIPSYVLLVTLGVSTLLHYKHHLKKYALIVLVILFIANYADFVNYYWYTYPKLTKDLFGDLTPYQDIKIFADESQKRQLTPYIATYVYTADEFYTATYFDTLPKKIGENEIPPEGGILLTQRENIPGMKDTGVTLPHFHILVRE